MRIFVAGASGAIGQPLIAELIRQGHTVAGMTRSDSGRAASPAWVLPSRRRVPSMRRPCKRCCGNPRPKSSSTN